MPSIRTSLSAHSHESNPPSSRRHRKHKDLCSYSFADGRSCAMPRKPAHPYLCVFHARKEAQALAGEEAGRDIAHALSGQYITSCDLASALSRLFVAVAQGHIAPKPAATLAYLGQTLSQTIHHAQHEFIQAYGGDSWRAAIRSSPTRTSAPLSPVEKPVSPPSPLPKTFNEFRSTLINRL